MNSEFQNWIDANLQSQRGKTILVTGGNSGIGYHAALALAAVGADVIIAGRNAGKIDRAVHDIRAQGIEGSIESGIVDLANLQSVKGFANAFRDTHSHLDVLINNAGVMMPPAGTTDDGLESQFGINFVGHFALTGRLYDILKATSGSRVVTLSSIAHRGARIDFDNLKLEKPYDPRREYYQSKLADIMFTLELARRVKTKGDDVLSVACHPGFTKTELQRHVDPELLAGLTFMDTWQGSLPTLVAATGGATPGDYFGPDGPKEFGGFPALGLIDDAALDTAVAQRLWAVGEDLTGVVFP
ncbi:MAG: NAD(P)-dependent dehydrogenase (short-subunit alcohol dehydrogenase family) [Paracoccaceae bacterium]|jgi:NAD(P)-dependent dehydrogenase (short-subunit alcohol dehydrogenase family)